MSSTRAPTLAAVREATIPAVPPPTTTTSRVSGRTSTLLFHRMRSILPTDPAHRSDRTTPGLFAASAGSPHLSNVDVLLDGEWLR